MLDLAILGLLHESPMHGYELRKQLATKLGAFRAAISYGSLYPTLRRLQTDGWITEEPAADCGTDPEVPPLTSRRGRVVYKITAEGKERFQALLAQAGPETYRRHRLRRALRVLRPHRPGHPPADPGGSPPQGRGAARRHARRAEPRGRAPRRIHARTAATWTGRVRARGPLAGGAHRHRALRPTRPGNRAATSGQPD